MSGWAIEKLATLVNVVYGKSPAEIEKIDDGFPIFGTGGVVGYTSEVLCNGPSVILGRKGTIDKVQRCDGPFWAIDTTYYTTAKREFDWSWLYYAISSFDLRKLNEASGVPSLSRSSLEALDVATPPLPEQQKIAAILTAVDDKLSVIARQIEATQTLKRGLMQTLFSRGVGTQDADGRWVPHTEFRDSELGEIPAGWECLRLGDVLAEKPEYGANASAVPFDAENRIRYLRITDIDEHGRLRSDSIKAIPSDEARDYILADGDLLIARSGNTVGKSILYKSAMGLCAFAGYLLRFRFGSTVLVDFVAEYLTSDTYWAWIKASVKVGAQPNINAQQYQAMFIPVPPTEEQQRIAAVLAGVDAKIELLRARQTQFQNLKRGLMQKLLTGEWRVSVDTSATGT